MANYEVLTKYSLTATHLTVTVTVHDIWAAKPVKRVSTRRIPLDGADSAELLRMIIVDAGIQLRVMKSLQNLF